MGFDAELWVQAEDDTEFAQSQIQGFLYKHRSDNTLNSHVVRDCRRMGNQVLWREDGTDEQYPELHAESERQIRIARAKLVNAQYLELYDNS